MRTDNYFDFYSYKLSLFCCQKGGAKNGMFCQKWLKKPVRQKNIQSEFAFRFVRQILLHFYLSQQVSYRYSIFNLNQKNNDFLARMFVQTPLNQEMPQSGLHFNEGKNLDSFIERLLSLKIKPFVIEMECPPNQFSQNSVSDDEGRNCPNPKKILTYNRKQKSLAELTKKFIQKFEGAECSYLALDQVTQEMKVERRRIYDIINIMQSLNVVTKIRKNIYKWKGLKQAVETIQNLGKNQKQNSQVLFRSRKEKSLELLATYFLKVFSQKKEVLTLEKASAYIINDDSEKENKTKVRRLYDIVNVFKSLGLIKKIKNQGAKPGYEWMGCEALIDIIEVKRRENQSTIKASREMMRENIDSNYGQMNQQQQLLEQFQIKLSKDSKIKRGSIHQNQEERKEVMMVQTTHKTEAKNEEYEKQVSIFNEVEGSQSYFCFMICQQRENGVKTLREFIEKFGRNLWNDIGSIEKQKEVEKQKTKDAKGFQSNKIVCQS